VLKVSTPLRKGSSVSLPSQLKAQQQTSKEMNCKETQDTASKSDVHMRSRLIRSNDLLTHTSTDTLLDLLKDYTGVKEISEETTVHLSMVRIQQLD
jgi:hypothetical protein